ncbi:hypothetical protein FY150_24695 (plasmid) [Agrobacterium tumefaciens]|nr:hypothetical protein FY150_24695 [Agrobacterium tumefaciens]
MGTAGWSIVGGIVGIVLGAVGGYFAGTVSGVFADTIGGEALAICKTAEIASSQNIISAEDANRLVALAAPEVMETGSEALTSLADCKNLTE